MRERNPLRSASGEEMRTAVRVACTRTPYHFCSLLLISVALVMSGCAAVVGGDTGSSTPPGSSTPVTISNVQAMGATNSAVHIFWMTSSAASSQVDYGTTAAYGTSTLVNPAMVTTHQVALAGLSAGTAYHYRVRSTDTNGNTAVSPDEAFTTAAAGGGAGTGDTTPPETFSISGTISPTTGGSGATVTLSGAAGATTTTNSSGAYTFTGLANGTYTVTPSNTGFTFAPGSANATIAGANVVGLNFTATKQAAQTFSISGTISPAAAGNGATVKLSGAANATTTANSSGVFTFTGLTNGTYTVTPSLAGFTFAPGSANATVNGANVTAINFTGTAQTFSISGTISPTTGGSGATVTLSGSRTATTTANSSGNYTFSGLGNGSYVVTPSKSGFKFGPTAETATINGANVTGVNFTATAQVSHSVAVSWTASTSSVIGYNIYRSTVSGSGYIKLNSAPVIGLTYTDTSVQSGTTYFYVARAVSSSGVESADSNQDSATIP
jgi:hypothetical protein